MAGRTRLSRSCSALRGRRRSGPPSSYYRDELGLRIIPGTGPLAAVVPGAFGGWMAMLRDFGTLHFRDVIRFAIGYAANGYPMLARTSSAIRSLEPLFRDEWTTSGDVYLPATAAGALAATPFSPPPTSACVREAEARSPDREGQIEAAIEIWYRGWVAEALREFPGKRAGWTPRASVIEAY